MYDNKRLKGRKTRLFHEFVDELIFFHQPVTAVASSRFVESLHPVRLYTGIPNEERNGFGRVRAKFAGRGMIGQNGDGNRFFPTLHSFINRPHDTPIQVFDGHPLQRDIARSEEHTSELQSRQYLVCRLLLEKKKKYFEHL